MLYKVQILHEKKNEWTHSIWTSLLWKSCWGSKGLPKSPLYEEASSESQDLTLSSANLQNHNLTFHIHTLSHGMPILSQTLVGKYHVSPQNRHWMHLLIKGSRRDTYAGQGILRQPHLTRTCSCSPSHFRF